MSEPKSDIDKLVAEAVDNLKKMVEEQKDKKSDAQPE